MLAGRVTVSGRPVETPLAASAVADVDVRGSELDGAAEQRDQVHRPFSVGTQRVSL